jgi:O-antigen/teichoic acid export membrane protein
MNLWIVGIESALEATASIALVLTAGGASAAAFGRAAGYAGGLLVAVVLVRRAFGRHAVALRKVQGAPPIARYAGVMLVVNGAYSLFSEIDVLLIGALLSSSAVGQFSAPLRLTVLLHYPGLALSNAVSPRMARGRAGEQPDVDTFRQALRLLIVVQFAIVTPMVVWATPIVDLILGPDYADSARVLRAMTPYIFLSGVGPVLAVSVNYLGAARRRVPVAIAAVIVNIVIDVALLREIGVVAAAIGTSVAYLVYTIGHAVICHELLGLHPLAMARTMVRCFVAAGAMAGVLALFGTGEVPVPGLVAGSICGLLVYAGVLVLTRELTAAEMARIRALVRRSG